ncbi:MAG: phosphoribosylamine--glycine ligase [Actinomycetota bacterium]
MKTLLLGAGGRESALAWALSRSGMISELAAAPGNPGIASVAPLFDLDPADERAVVDLARRLGSELVVVGPEAPLVAGVGDALRADGRLVFGPDAAAARIEGSKWHAKELMRRAGIPTAEGAVFTDARAAVDHADRLGPPYVIKADGLAAGKGVMVTSDRGEAVDAIEQRLVAGALGAAGATVVVEEFLDGPELSLIAFVDGATARPCEPAQDYKRIDDGDRGPNTGGMGAYSPVPACSAELVESLMGEVIEPMVKMTATTDPPAPFVGALYAGLALTTRGPRVIEFNARFGDPETQALLPRLGSDLGELCVACATGDLAGFEPRWSTEVCVAVVLSAAGYPGSHATGAPIEGLDDAARIEGAHIFHAGTAIRDGATVTAGGRVLAVAATGADFGSARTRAYTAADRIRFEGKHVRRDIARRAEEAR